MQGRLARLTDSLTPAEGGASEELSAGASKREQLHGEHMGTRSQLPGLSNVHRSYGVSTSMQHLCPLEDTVCWQPGCADARGYGSESFSQKQHTAVHTAAVGGRIKYLVDTPETLWGCLDAGSFLAAAHRFLRASLVYEALQGGDAASAMRQFPLVRTQWPLVAKFRSDPVGAEALIFTACQMLYASRWARHAMRRALWVGLSECPDSRGGLCQECRLTAYAALTSLSSK
jgi:hypothetical protein